MELHAHPCGIRIITSPLYHSSGLLGSATELAAESSYGVHCEREQVHLGYVVVLIVLLLYPS